jgi:hypothetical protein
MFVLKAIVCEVNHKIILVFNVFLMIFFDGKTEITGMEKSDEWTTVD